MAERKQSILVGDTPNAWALSASLFLRPFERDSKFDTSLGKDLADALAQLRVEALSLLLLDGESETLRLLTSVGHDEGRAIPDLPAAADPLSLGAFTATRSMSSNSMQSPLARDPTLEKWRRCLGSRQLHHIVCVPFFRDFEIHGVLRAFNRLDDQRRPARRGFSRADIATVEYLTHAVSARAEVVWQRHAERLLNRVAHDMTAAEGVEQVAVSATRAAAELTRSAAAVLYLIDINDARNLRLAGSHGLRPHPELARFPVATSISGRVATRGKAEYVANLYSAAGVANVSVAREEHLVSCLALPTGQAVQGALVVFRRSDRPISPQTMAMLEHLASLTGTLLLLRSQRLEASAVKDRLLAASHSLGSPLARVSNNLHKLRSFIPPDRSADAEVLLTRMYAELEVATQRRMRMLFATSGVVGVSKLNIQRDVDLSALVRRSVDRYEDRAHDRNLSIELTGAHSSIPRIACDPLFVELVFDNLLENAIKYSWKNEVIYIGFELASQAVRIRVTDKGLGVPPSYEVLIFEGLARSPILDRTRYIYGTGLGLALVKQVVDAHGGAVSVRSVPFIDDPQRLAAYEGFETTFTLTLPIQAGGGTNVVTPSRTP